MNQEITTSSNDSTGLYFDYLITSENNEVLASKERGKEPEMIYPEKAIDQLLIIIREKEEQLLQKDKEIMELKRAVESLQNVISDSEELNGKNIERISRLEGKVKEALFNSIHWATDTRSNEEIWEQWKTKNLNQ